MHQAGASGRRLLGAALTLLVVYAALVVTGTPVPPDPHAPGPPALTLAWGAGGSLTDSAVLRAERVPAGHPGLGAHPAVAPRPSPPVAPDTRAVRTSPSGVGEVRPGTASTSQERAPPSGIG